MAVGVERFCRFLKVSHGLSSRAAVQMRWIIDGGLPTR